MKAVVVYGSMHKGSTYNCVRIFKEELLKLRDVEFTEFFLPKDMPHFCAGCFSCFLKGEEHCPHYESMKPIEEALVAADLIILSSPGYVLSVSGAMKALLDHLAFCWMPHRPHPSMFSKVGVAFTTAAGAGTKKTLGVMRDSFTFWGMKKSYAYSKNVAAMRWEDVKPQLKEKISRDTAALAKNVNRALNHAGKPAAKPFTRVMFYAMRLMQKSNKYNLTDRAHWEKNGWLDGKKPF